MTAVSALTAGCSAPGSAARLTSAANMNLIFNHSFIAGDAPVTQRAPWPVTAGDARFSEAGEYRTTLFDYQGNSGGRSDRYQRRFHSIRKGRTHR